MKTNTHTAPIWSTASFGHTTDVSPLEVAALGKHLNLCKSPHGGLLALQYLAQRLHGFVSTRFVTTLVIVLVLLIGVSSLVL